MAAFWRSFLWSCCLMGGPTSTQWVAADSGCSKEATETVTTRPTLNTWRTSRLETRRSTLKQIETHENIRAFSLRSSQVDGSELELLQHLHDSVYQQTQEWYQRLGSRIHEQINKQYGAMPDKEEDIQVWNRNISTSLICCCAFAWLQYVFVCWRRKWLWICLPGLIQWSGLVLVAVVRSSTGPCISN